MYLCLIFIYIVTSNHVMSLNTFHRSSVQEFSCLYAIDFRVKSSPKFRTPKLKSMSFSNFTSISAFEECYGNRAIYHDSSLNRRRMNSSLIYNPLRNDLYHFFHTKQNHN